MLKATIYDNSYIILVNFSQLRKVLTCTNNMATVAEPQYI